MPLNNVRTNSELDVLKEIVRLLKEQQIIMQLMLAKLEQIEINTQ